MMVAVMAAVCGFALLAGVMIGCIGIGGVILVPALYYVEGIQIHTAIAAAMLAYLVSGAIGTFVFWRKKSIDWSMTVPLWLGAMPTALAGALVGDSAQAHVLEFTIGLLTAGSGLQSLLTTPTPAVDDRQLTAAQLAGVGAFVGFASALTGTGGPLVLVPILLWLGLPVLVAIGLSQSIQLPIAALATAGNTYNGSIDWVLGGLLAVGMAFGTWAGARLAHAVPRAMLKRLISVVLTGVGTAILMKAIGRGLG